ncbi:FAD:protein FMN transferase [Mangrovicoccus sp. HB161399]|uniref:FAD:protein FMN transferase n=1 Tax=Mangrovicoccus sp. HB161399 TaxID=2720392 RepID=UPI0015523066|nr:FAD:protein FMN transferase [Mangrovicoccus sp. HB161399]
MTLTRRRLLAIAAAAAAFPGAGHAASWRGRAFGADVAVTLRGRPGQADAALREMQAMIRALEARFSLYDPGSDLSRLNAAGRLEDLHPWMAELLGACGRIHRLTGGRFDPSIQSLWTSPPGPVGWERALLAGNGIVLAPGQSLTLNGIAQGHAADRISALLAGHGFADTLVDLGEFRASGGPWTLGVADPEQGLLGYRTIRNGAVATSSPGAMRTADGRTHILDPGNPQAAARWSTVSVEAETATLADGLSTAFCMMDRAEIAAVFDGLPELRRVTLVSPGGDLETLSG